MLMDCSNMNQNILKSTRRKRIGKQKNIAVQEFSDAVSVLTSLCFDNQASLYDQSKEILCELLKDLALEISNLVQSSRKRNISQNDITDAVQRLLPKELARHAIAEGARMLFLHQNEMLKPRSKSVEKTMIPIKTRKRKHSAAIETSPKAKRRRKSTAKKTSLKKAPKRTFMSKTKTKRKLSKRRSRKLSTSKKEIKLQRKSPSRKRAPARYETPERRKKPSLRKRTPTENKIVRTKKRKKSISSKRVPVRDETPKRRKKPSSIKRTPTDNKILRSKRRKKSLRSPARDETPERPKRSSSRKRTPKKDKILRTKRRIKSLRKRAPTRDKTPKRQKGFSGTKLKSTRVETTEFKIPRKKSVSSSRRKKSRTRKSPRKVSPKTVQKISKTQPTKKKIVSKQETTHAISSIVKTEIKSGMQKLNKSYKQELSTAGEKLIVQCLYNLLDYLSDEMKKGKSSSIGPVDVRRAIIKIFPKELADLAIAEMSRILMA